MRAPYIGGTEERGAKMSNTRRVLRISGDDRLSFLEGLVTNAVPTEPGHLVYAALLSPQGKYLADFFLQETGDALWLDADAAQADGLAKRLMLYKLRASVEIDETGIAVSRGTGPAPEGALPDPRHSSLGWRLYGTEASDDTDWDALRVAECVPEAGKELFPDESYILEAGFERLHGVDFKKGCYVGQEVTARMKHKTELRKGLAVVDVAGETPPGTEITVGGKSVGTLYTQSQGRGIAYLRFDRAGSDMAAGPAKVTWSA